MADFITTGLSTYLLDNEQTQEGLKELAGYIELLKDPDGNQTIAPTNEFEEQYEPQCNYEDKAQYQNDPRATLYFNSAYFYSTNGSFPDDMPEDCHVPNWSRITVKGVPMIRLYVGLVSKGGNLNKTLLVDNLKPLLHELFDPNIVKMTMREADENMSFNNAVETVFVTANK